jgi:hypothetical protein
MEQQQRRPRASQANPQDRLAHIDPFERETFERHLRSSYSAAFI